MNSETYMDRMKELAQHKGFEESLANDTYGRQDIEAHINPVQVPISEEFRNLPESREELIGQPSRQKLQFPHLNRIERRNFINQMADSSHRGSNFTPKTKKRK